MTQPPVLHLYPKKTVNDSVFSDISSTTITMKFILVFERQLVVTALLLLLMWLCSVDSQKSIVGTCNSAEIDSRARDPCVPCPSQKWFGMSKSQINDFLLLF